jgi:sulfur carrier protein ThiS adenylyltransferase
MTFNEIKSKLSKFTVGIAGAGGLGSNCAIALARSGIGKLIIVDFDFVNESNLNRQYYFEDQIGLPKVEALEGNLLRIRQDISIRAYNKKVDESNIFKIFKDADIIIEAFDDASMKKMLIEKVMETFPEKYIISGMGMAGFGQSNIIKAEYYEHLVVCGDQISEVSEEFPPLGPRVGIVANMQANEAINILINTISV